MEDENVILHLKLESPSMIHIIRMCYLYTMNKFFEVYPSILALLNPSLSLCKQLANEFKPYTALVWLISTNLPQMLQLSIELWTISYIRFSSPKILYIPITCIVIHKAQEYFIDDQTLILKGPHIMSFLCWAFAFQN